MEENCFKKMEIEATSRQAELRILNKRARATRTGEKNIKGMNRNQLK